MTIRHVARRRPGSLCFNIIWAYTLDFYDNIANNSSESVHEILVFITYASKMGRLARAFAADKYKA